MSETKTKHKVLVAGPHPDDQEIGMGGTIIELLVQGHDVHILDMTNGEPTPYGTPELREKEWRVANKILSGAARKRTPMPGKLTRELLGLTNREVQHTLEARHRVAGVIREQQIHIIFLPFEEDAHPDHRAVTRIVEDARFDAKLTKIDLPGKPIYPKWLFYYYCSHLRQIPNPTFLLDMTASIDAKIDAIKAYETQFILPEKNRRVLEWMRQMNGYMGSRIGTGYAEPFFTKEPLGLNGLASLSF